MSPHTDQARWFAEQVQPHEAELRAFIRRRFPQLADVDDVVQETYRRLLQAQSLGGKILEPRAYLFGVARNAAVDFFRRQRPASMGPLGNSESADVVDVRSDAAEILNHAQEVALLTEAVRSLPERCREVFVLRKFHGLSYRDIATRLNVSEKTVSAHLESGLMRCRQYLAARGVRRMEEKSPAANE